MDRVLMTPEGQAKLRERLKVLKKVERPQNIKDIEVARAHGDLSENAEYHAAKERQGFIAKEMTEIESALSNAEVIDPSKMNHEHVTFGAKITLLDVDSEDEKKYQIVGAMETDLDRGKISIESPIARALIGKKVDDEVSVRTPGGVKEFEIVEIDYS
jgi:transcription elongation factor GreA